MKVIFKKQVFEDYMKDNNLSKTKFCKLCGINISTFNKIMKDDIHFRTSALFKIAKAVKVEVYEMFDDE